MQTSTIAFISVGAVLTGVAAYAAYFDHRRQTDPEFRKQLKRQNRRQDRLAREEKESRGKEQEVAIRQAVKDAQNEGFPTDMDEKEQYFMSEVAVGESMCAEGSDPVKAALCFYKALKVYPQPDDLVKIYDKTVPKDVLEILASMVAMDQDLKIGSLGTSGSDSGHGVE